jgi:AcrR family transcriptional regulator
MDAREQLLHAAMKVYSTSGVRGATTKKIAQEAGVNEVTLFRHFGSKDALMQEALRWKAQALFTSTLPAEPVDPFAELLAFSQHHYDALSKHRDLIRVSMGEFAEHPEATQLACREAAAMDAALRSYLERMRAKGWASGDWQPELAASMLLGMLFSDVMGRDCMPQCYPFSPTEGIRQYVTLFLKAIDAAVSVPAPSRGIHGLRVHR